MYAGLHQSLEDGILFNHQRTLGMGGIQCVLLQEGDVTGDGLPCKWQECVGFIDMCRYVLYSLFVYNCIETPLFPKKHSIPCRSSIVLQSCQHPAAGSYTRTQPAMAPLLLQHIPRLLRGTRRRATASCMASLMCLDYGEGNNDTTHTCTCEHEAHPIPYPGVLMSGGLWRR